MNNITSSKLLAHLDRVVGDRRPITADVFLDNFCNNRCDYCLYRNLPADEARSMSFEDFKRYAVRMTELGVQGIILSGGGEPSISKDFDQITAWLDENGYKWGVNTNFVRYFEAHPQYLKVSLDAWNRESYIADRKVDAYEQVRENIWRYADVKGDTKLGIQMVAKNEFDVYRFHEANAMLPVDYINIRPVESTDGEYYSKALGKEFKPKNIIKAIRYLQSCDDRVVLNYKWEMRDFRVSECYAQWSQLALNEKGEVMYCCHKPEMIVGHIMDADILEKKSRAVPDMGTCYVPCRLSAPNQIMAQINSQQTNIEFI